MGGGKHKELMQGAPKRMSERVAGQRIAHYVGLTLFVGAALWAASAVMLAFLTWGFWPGIVATQETVFGPADAAATQRRVEAMDDCLVKAAAEQIPGRLVQLVARDLGAACKYRVARVWLAWNNAAMNGIPAIPPGYPFKRTRDDAMNDITSGFAWEWIEANYAISIIQHAKPRFTP
jgi:hypothetical protein